MKTRYKITILALILIPATVMITLVAQSIQYKMTIAQFERTCENLREQDNRPDADCMWPGGPPKKPLIEIP